MLYIERVLYCLSRIIAILEFRFDFNRMRFLKSNIGFFYVAATNLILTVQVLSWPDAQATFSTTLEISQTLINFNLYLHCLAICIVNINLLYNRRKIQSLLNHCIRLREMHNQVFGTSVKVPIIYIIYQFFRDFWFLSKVGGFDIFDFEWEEVIMFYQCIRLWWQSYLINIAMMLQYQLLKPLAERMSSFPPKGKEKRELYIKYILQLIRLRQKLQIFVWPFVIYRLLAETEIIIGAIIEHYWIPFSPRLRDMLIEMFIFSNGICMMMIAKSIYRMEVQILERLYVRELFDILLKFKPQRNLNELRVSIAASTFTYLF